MTFWSWSKTAGTDATADSTINWAEGQAPSSVNDSARAMMAALSKYRDDTAGSITTGGTSTAYTITTSQVFDSLAHMGNAKIAFIPHTSSGATVTLAVDGLTAKPLRGFPSVELAASDLVSGTVYVCTYNASDAVFYLHNFTPNFIPSGTLMLFQQTSAPSGWTKQTTHNDKVLRVVSGTASSGGTSPFSTVFGLTSTSSYALLTADIPSHTHTDSGHTHGVGVSAAGLGLSSGALAPVSGTSSVSASATAGSQSGTASLSSTGGGGGHSHGIELRVNYVDLIIAQKG